MEEPLDYNSKEDGLESPNMPVENEIDEKIYETQKHLDSTIAEKISGKNQVENIIASRVQCSM